jgi:2-methylisoborneol synthase
MTLIDVVGGYELPSNVFCERQFHQALMQAGTASVIVNDLYSVAREAADELPDSNLVLLIAAEEKIPVKDATARVVALHNDFVRAFEASQSELMAVPSPELHRSCAVCRPGWPAASNGTAAVTATSDFAEEIKT